MQLDPHPTQFLSLREIGLGVNRDDFDAIGVEIRTDLGLKGVDSGLFWGEKRAVFAVFSG
jgi:hypothetical protein